MSNAKQMNLTLDDEICELFQQKLSQGFHSQSEYARFVFRDIINNEAALKDLNDKLIEGINSPLSGSNTRDILNLVMESKKKD